jgi:hypothetical protein
LVLAKTAEARSDKRKTGARPFAFRPLKGTPMAERNDIKERFRIQGLNSELVRRINDELLGDPNHRYAGKWIGIANGQIVVVADTQDEVLQRLKEIEPDSFRCAFLEGVGMTEEESNAIYGA